MDEEKNDLELEQEQDPEEKDDLQWARITKLIKAVRPGYSIAVHRMRPAWCKGYLERLEFLDDDDHLDLDYLADTWGGEVLRLRFCDENGTYKRSVDIPFYSYPPKFRGRIIRRGQINEDSDPNVRYEKPEHAPMMPIAVQSNQSDTLSQMLGLLKQTRGDDLRVFKEILGKMPTDPPVIGNTLEGFIDFARQFKELKGLFGDAEQKMVPEGENNAALFQTIGEVIKAMTAKPVPRLIQQVPSAIAAPGQGASIADRLAGLPHEKAAEQFCSALQKMDSEKRENTIKSIFSLLGVENDLAFGDDTDPDDDEDEDEDEDDRRE